MADHLHDLLRLLMPAASQRADHQGGPVRQFLTLHGNILLNSRVTILLNSCEFLDRSGTAAICYLEIRYLEQILCRSAIWSSSSGTINSEQFINEFARLVTTSAPSNKDPRSTSESCCSFPAFFFFVLGHPCVMVSNEKESPPFAQVLRLQYKSPSSKPLHELVRERVHDGHNLLDPVIEIVHHREHALSTTSDPSPLMKMEPSRPAPVLPPRPPATCRSPTTSPLAVLPGKQKDRWLFLDGPPPRNAPKKIGHEVKASFLVFRFLHAFFPSFRDHPRPHFFPQIRIPSSPQSYLRLRHA